MNLRLSGNELQRVEESKFLGIIIDQHLTWKNHIDYITKKIIRTTGLLCRIRFYVNQTHLKMLYNSLIYPYLHYGNIVWANNYPTRLDKSFKLQKKVLRIITFSPYTAPSLPPFSSPEPTILLVCAKDRDLWQGPKQEVRESRTSGSCAQPQKFEQ